MSVKTYNNKRVEIQHITSRPPEREKVQIPIKVPTKEVDFKIQCTRKKCSNFEKKKNSKSNKEVLGPPNIKIVHKASN